MLKKIMVFLILLISFNSQTFSADLDSVRQEEIKRLSNIDKVSSKIQQNNLPPPYRELLTQPLMTKALQNYYQREPIIKTLYAVENKGNTYSRAILMLVDMNKIRNNAKCAQKKKEATVVELAFITINFNALPKKMIQEIRHTDAPFGALLSRHHIKIDTIGRHYFSTPCQAKLAALIHCNLNSKIYGRRNRIIRADNKEWLAHVVEVLP